MKKTVVLRIEEIWSNDIDSIRTMIQQVVTDWLVKELLK